MEQKDGEEKWDDWEEEDELSSETVTVCLFDRSKKYRHPGDCWKNAAKEYDFDIVKVTKELHLSTYDHIKVVNYLRSLPPDQVLSAALNLTNEPKSSWKSDIYLKPVIPDDPLLTATDFGEDDDLSWSDEDAVLAPVDGTAGERKDTDLSKLSKEELILKLKKSQNALLESQMKTAQLECIVANLRQTTQLYLLGKEKETEEEYTVSTSPNIFKKKDEGEEEDYFSSYAHHGIHQIMIADEVRTNAYRDFIQKNPYLFEGKVVMDVGCGTGILSFFASQAGARRVFAVDNSAIIDVAERIAAENSISNVKFIKSKVEKIESLGDDIQSVDIIISEWMGYCLLFECMLPSVLVARERWCGKTGLVYPDIASMYLSAWHSEDYYKKKIGFWSNVYGFSMNSMKDQAWSEPLTEPIPSDAIRTESCLFKSFNINTVRHDELDFTSDFSLVVQSGGGRGTDRNNNSQEKKNIEIHGFVAHFDIEFRHCKNPIVFSTGPFTKDTHWHQTIFFLEKPVEVEQNDIIFGKISCKRNQHHRNLLIEIEYSINHLKSKTTSPPSHVKYML